jgi:hypothetical protein
LSVLSALPDSAVRPSGEKAAPFQPIKLHVVTPDLGRIAG